MCMTSKSSFIPHLLEKYPNFKQAQLDLLVSDQLISPFQISLSPSVLTQIQNEIKSYWSFRSWGEKNISEKYDKYDLRKPANFSACMSYDFHVNSEQQLELIEINTNAAFLALGLELYDYHKIPNAVPFFETDLVEMFKNEMQLCGRTKTASLSIVDENPQKQRLFVEFLVYQEILNRNGLNAKIVNLADVTKDSSFIYNRYTDFYLQNEASANLKQLYNSTQIDLSPNPWDYFLLADKQRLIDWNHQTDLPKPNSLLPVYDLAVENREKIWSERKQLFFKPKNSFGSKQAYKGASISKTTFENAFTEGFIAQKISNPSEITATLDGATVKFKYDLRCYAYQDKLQMIIARLYQGQTTNLKTVGGGFACVVIK